MEDGAEVDVSFQGDEDILEFIRAVDEQESMTNETEEAVIDVARSQPEWECQVCGKKLKTTAGLKRHKKLKHTEGALEPEKIKVLLYNACYDLSKDRCYGEEVNKLFAAYYTEEFFDQPTFVDKDLYTIINNLCLILSQTKNKEMFYAKFYEVVVQNAKEYFASMSSGDATLLLITLCEKLINEVAMIGDNAAVVESKKFVPKQRDMSAIQYLGGFVLRKLRYAIKPTSPENQLVINILEANKVEDVEDRALISTLTRGGLWGISSHVCFLLLEAEKTFREEVSSKNTFNYIAINQMVDSLMKSMVVIDLYYTVLEDCSCYSQKYEEIAFNLLEKIFTLYLRVRSFSFVKDFTEKLKSKDSIKRGKALRKELKNNADKKENGE